MLVCKPFVYCYLEVVTIERFLYLHSHLVLRPRKMKTFHNASKQLYDFVFCKILKQPDTIVEKTGICADYYNEWLSYRAVTLKYQNDPEKAYQWLRKHSYPLKKYNQRETSKHHWLTGKTKKRVEMLDKIVDEFNCMLESPSKFDMKRARTLSQRASVLTRGVDDMKYVKLNFKDIIKSKTL